MTTSKAASSRSRPFAVEALDRLPQLADRLDHVLALGDDRLQPLGQFLLLFLGAQIDGAQPLALDLQPFEPALDIGDIGQRAVGLQPGVADHQMRRRVQRLLHARLDLAPPLVGGGQPLLGAGAALARFRQRLDRSDRRLVALGLLVLGLLQPVGRRLAQGLGLRQLRHQRAPALARSRRARLRALACSACASARRSPSEAIWRSAFSPRGDPAGALGGDRGQPPGALLGLALQPVMAGARVGQRRTVALHVCGKPVERRLQLRQVGRCVQAALRPR